MKGKGRIMNRIANLDCLCKTALYAADVSVFADPQLYAEAYAAASPARREKIDRYHFAKDRYLSLGAETLLHYALRLAGIRELPVTFDYGPQGKPYLKDGCVYFNISHSGNWVICAVSACEVGCDVEKIVPIDLKIAERFFFHEEYDDIAAQTTQETQNEMFYRYWTLKESFMKATGLGMKLPLDSFRIVLGSEISVEQSVDGRNYRFIEYDVIPGCKCALCTAGDGRAAALHMTDLRQILNISKQKKKY